MAQKLIVLDTTGGDLAELAEAFRTALDSGCEIQSVTGVDELLDKCSEGTECDIAVVDYELGDGSGNGPEVVRKIRAADRDLPIAAVAEQGNVELAAGAIKDGATDFLVRGHNLADRVETLLGKIKNMLSLIRRNRALDHENKLLRREISSRFQIVGESDEICDIIVQCERVAKIPRPVLITGERGTGKELVARAIHAAGGAKRPIVTVNCAAFTDNLLESELFGHEKGAFTGADSMRPGKFELADNGSLFLDEIGNMTIEFQKKILRVVEYGTFTRVGGTKEIKTTARIIAATNCDLRKKMECGEFLRDLYDRLSFEVIRVPSLSERKGDLEVLARYFLEQFAREIPAFQGKRLSDEAVDMLEEYSFPGNVRELKNIIERAAYRDTTNVITPEDIGLLPKHRPEGDEGGSFDERVESYKRRLIEGALESAGGNQAEAARRLGLSYHQFRYYYKKLGESVVKQEAES